MRKPSGRLAAVLLAAALSALFVLPCAAFATETTPTVVRAQDDQARVRFSGRWTYKWRTAYSGESARISNSAGAASKLTFDGTGISWISQVGPKRGRARVYLDGEQREIVDLYSATAENRKTVWSVSGLPDGIHTLRVVALGDHNSASAGSWVVVDAFDIEGTLASSGSLSGVRVEQGDRRLYRKGRWYRDERAGAYSGAAMRAASSGRSVTVRFRGTGVMWFGRKDAQGGLAEVYLDGDKVATVSQRRAGSSDERRVSWAATGLRDGYHNVRIKVLGEPSVTGGGTRVDVDAFQIKGTPVQALRPTPFTYPWRTYIVIDKSEFRLYWVKDGMLVKTYPVALGRVGMTTPSRVWRIGIKYHTSPGSVYGPRKMRLFKRVAPGAFAYTAYAIHGTNQEWVIGTRASHGCIRMYNRDVLELFPQVPVGTMVVTRD